MASLLPPGLGRVSDQDVLGHLGKDNWEMVQAYVLGFTILTANYQRTFSSPNLGIGLTPMEKKNPFR